MDLPHTQQWHHKHNKYPKKTKMFLFAWWVKKSLMWETIDDALNVFYWELRIFILDVVYHYIGPWNVLLSLSRTISRYTSLQYVAQTQLLQTTNLSPIYFWQLSDSSLWRISTQLKFSGKPIIIDLVDKSKSFGPAYTDHINLML